MKRLIEVAVPTLLVISAAAYCFGWNVLAIASLAAALILHYAPDNDQGGAA